MTYKELQQLVKYHELPVCGKNEDGENVIVEHGNCYFKVTTAQNNGWTRINVYHANGTTEETYQK